MKVLYNGRVYLGKNNYTEALIIDRGRIVKTGSSRDLLAEAPAGAEKIDAEGALVTPAFCDSHLHLVGVGRRAGGVECSGAKSIGDVINRGRARIASMKPAPGTYILGAGVNPDLFTEGEKRDLTREDLDKISTEYPVILSRHCGHTIFCNSAALKLAGLSEAAPEVEGGTVEKDSTGRPTGVFRENANGLVRKPVPPATKGNIKDYLTAAMKKAHSLGITSCGSYDSGGADFENVTGIYREIFDEAREAESPALRVTMQCGVSAREELLDAHLGRNISRPLWEDPLWGSFLKRGPIKLFADGTLGGRTAWMRQPYRDKPETRGFPVLEQETLKRFVRKAAAGGMQVLIHAIGDAGIDAALTAFEQVTGKGENPLRHGVVHCQITSPDLLERMARNGILAFVQPIFLADDSPVLESRVGPELAATSYAWGSMHRLGISVSYGTDAPVSDLDPLLGIQWAAWRGLGKESQNPGERVDIHTALDAYTGAAAFSGFDENSLGRIAPGFLADLVFLDRNILELPPGEISKAKVQRTICAGETVYRA